MSNRLEIVKLVSMLAEAFGRKPSTATFAAYELGLEGIGIDAITGAVATSLRTSKYMPTPAELRELSGELKGTDRAVKAWLAFEKAVARIGGYKTVSFDDPVINATVRSVGGWQHCCTMTCNEFDTFLRKKFIDAYESLYRSGVGEEEAAPLRGEFDQANARLGYEPQQVVLVPTGLPAPLNAPRIQTTRHKPSGLLTLKTS